MLQLISHTENSLNLPVLFSFNFIYINVEAKVNNEITDHQTIAAKQNNNKGFQVVTYPPSLVSLFQLLPSYLLLISVGMESAVFDAVSFGAIGANPWSASSCAQASLAIIWSLSSCDKFSKPAGRLSSARFTVPPRNGFSHTCV